MGILGDPKKVAMPCDLRHILLSVVALLLVLSARGALAAPVSAEACSAATEQIREEEHASALPDCRGYEQVSPVAKNGLDALGGAYTTQASPTGLPSRVSFYSLVPFPGIAGSAEIPSYLGVRSEGGWSSEGLQPQADPQSTNDRVLGLTKDLARTLLLAQEPPLAPGATLGARNAYVRDNSTGTYQLLAPDVGFSEIAFVDASSDDSRILFETTTSLPTSNQSPASGFTNLYEWNEAMPVGERISLAGVVPPPGEQMCGGVSEPTCETPSQGSVGGPGGPAIPGYNPNGKPGGSVDHFYTQNTLSEDGSRVFFTDVQTGIVYMREPASGRTIQVSAGVASALWQAATPSGSFAFYIEGGELYRFNVSEDKREAITSGAEGTLGTLGISDDGAYVYFVAPGVLVSNKNGNNDEAVKGAANLYKWQEGVVTFIARLAGAGDKADWSGFFDKQNESGGPAGGLKSSRVAPDGKTALFSSVANLTSYPTNGNTEFYLYDSAVPLSEGNPVCVSCNPRALAATNRETRLASEGATVAAIPAVRRPFLTHNLADTGTRVFFQSEEALVPGDVNHQLDVYEWESKNTGSCSELAPSFSEPNGGCLYLISSGTSPQLSYFGNSDAGGENVFFFTRQSLVAQDQGENADLYDARVEGGIPAQNIPPTSTQCAEEATCRGASPAPPAAFGPPASSSFSGVGNLTGQAPIAVPSTKSLTRAEKLTKALKACRSKPKAKRKRCRSTARRLYGSKPNAKRARRRGAQS